MKKTIFTLLTFLALSISGIYSQAAIGDINAVDLGVVLDVFSGDKRGYFVPRVCLKNIDAWEPLGGKVIEGMIVFNTNDSNEHKLQGKGLYVWYNGRWHIINRDSALCLPASAA